MDKISLPEGLSMEELWRVMQQLQAENKFQCTFERLQSTPISNIVSIMPPNPVFLAKEPHVSLFNKFNGTQMKF